MVRNELCVRIPSYFKCPISMEVMKSPVSLSTGVTYDRCSIQRWLETGHTTCPATMQTLSSPSFVPNHTLLRLIHLWPSLSLPSLQTRLSNNGGEHEHEHEHEHVALRKLVGQVTSSDESYRVLECLRKVCMDAKKSEEYCRVLEKCEGLLDNIMRLIMLFDQVNGKIESLEIMLIFIDLVVSDLATYKNMINCLPKFDYVMQNGSLQGKIATTNILHKIVKNDGETKRMVITESPKVIIGAYNLVKSDDNIGIKAGLGLLIALAEDSRPLIKELVRLDVVKRVGEIFSEIGMLDDKAVTLRMMEVLEMVVMTREGRKAVCEEEKVVGEVVRRLMKVSEKVTEHGVTVLWSVCYKFRDEKVVEVVRKCNGVGKCLLLLQSNCKGVVKSICVDLVKALRGNGKSNLASYHTKTTHIMAY